MFVCVPDLARTGEVGGEEAIVSLRKPDKQVRQQTGWKNPIKEEWKEGSENKVELYRCLMSLPGLFCA